MGTADNDRLRDAIRRTLAHRAGAAPDAGAIAAATLATWHQTAARLAPVIGTRGVDALFVRALHLTSAAFPWLAMAGEHGNGAARLANFRARLEASEPAIAAEAGHALLATFNELLATLIGASLTERLLKPVWVPPPPSDQESAT